MSRVSIQKGKVGINSLGGYEKTSALVGVFGTVSGVAGELVTGVPLQFRSLVEAEAFGIAENKLLYHHISEYFRIAGSGASLYVLNVAAPENFAAMIAAASVKQLLSLADGNIFNLAFAYVPVEEGVAVDGLHAETLPAIKAAQALADEARQTNRPLHIILEGACYKGAAATALNLRDIKADGVPVMCPNVSLMIGQDWAFAETLSGTQNKYAAVGSLLGCMAAQPVSYNVGEVETMSLTDAARQLWIQAGLSSHVKVKEAEADLLTLNDKGYIFGEYYSGLAVLNDDHVCAPVVVDAEGNMNEHSIAISRTNAKVFREIHKVYLPKVKATVPVDASTGKLAPGMIKYFEGLGDRVFENMAAKQELSAGETTVDPESNLLFGEKALKVFYNWVPMGNIGRIAGTVNIRRIL